MTGWTEDGLIRSWRALAPRQGDEEWRLVTLATLGQVTVHAGRNFPDSREALVVTFPAGWLSKVASLPEGKGFEATLIEGHASFHGSDGIGLIRRLEGSFEIFATMCVNLLCFLAEGKSGGGPPLVGAFLQRVRDWLDFMSRSARPLSLDQQAGLYGELVTLTMLLETMPGSAAFGAWKGPTHAAQDFHLGSGALEVKTTTTTDAFKARINSIEQLDSERQPMFIGAIRLAEDLSGSSLNDMVMQLRETAEPIGCRRGFDAMLFMNGYFDDHAPHYERKLAVQETKFHHIDEDFPAVRRARLPNQVTSASYVLDLSSIHYPDVGISGALTALGFK